jgi:hypothetical protein
MSRVILRLQSLALKEDGIRSTLHLAVEDDAAIAACHAPIEEHEDGRIDVGELDGYRGGIDGETFREIVERVYWEQVRRIGRLAAVVPVMSCIVALGEQEIVLDGGRIVS